MVATLAAFVSPSFNTPLLPDLNTRLHPSDSTPWTIVFVLTLITVLPAIVMCMTPLVRLLVVFHFLRQALGTQTAPSNPTLMGLALMMTWFLMTPVLNQVDQQAVEPYRAGQITGLQAIDQGSLPIKHFLLHYAREKDLALFATAGLVNRPNTADGHIAPGDAHSHRIPLGLILMQLGSISHSQLLRALEAQKVAGKDRLGFWLIRDRATTEDMVTKALSVQWSCPVLTVEHHDAPKLAPAMPRLFADAFASLPLRLAAEKVLYLGFEERPDPVLALALGRMIGLQIESGVVPTSFFKPAHARFLQTHFPSAELVEAVSQSAAAYALARAIEKARPVASRLVRVHDCLWLRMWLRPSTGSLPEIDGVTDVVCSIRSLQNSRPPAIHA